MQIERTTLTVEQVSGLVDELQAELEQANRSLDNAVELAKRIEYASDAGVIGSTWHYVGEAARAVAENAGGGESTLDPGYARAHVDVLRDLVALAIKRGDPIDRLG